MGLYQVCPGCGGQSEYVLTTPLFDSTALTVAKDISFTVSASKQTSDDIYIQSATLDGQDYNCAFIPHQRIVQGGSLVSFMSLLFYSVNKSKLF
jgi:putative alpha-1,2-mannosidase